MEKIKLSQLLKYGKDKYLKTKLDPKIKEKILEKTIYKKNIFGKIFQYKGALASVAIVFVLFSFLFTSEILKNKSTQVVLESVQMKKEQPSNRVSKGFSSQSSNTIGVASAEKQEKTFGEGVDYYFYIEIVLVSFVIGGLFYYLKRRKNKK